MTDVRLSVSFCAAHTHGVNTASLASRTRRSKSNEVETSNRVIENAHEPYPMRQAGTRGAHGGLATESRLTAHGDGAWLLRHRVLGPPTSLSSHSRRGVDCRAD